MTWHFASEPGPALDEFLYNERARSKPAPETGEVVPRAGRQGGRVARLHEGAPALCLIRAAPRLGASAGAEALLTPDHDPGSDHRRGQQLRDVLYLWVAVVQTETTSYTVIAMKMLFLGSGIGLSTAPATKAILGVLRPEQAGVGSAVNDATGWSRPRSESPSSAASTPASITARSTT